MNKPVSILIVDDNPDDRLLITTMLEESRQGGFDIAAAAKLNDAAANVAGLKFDIILLDLGLPESQGLDTYARMRAAAPRTPIIILTGNDDLELASAAVHDGAQDYLVKGKISPDLLFRSIRYAIERFAVTAQLIEKTAALEALYSKMITVQEEERKRICRNLHDELGQWLTALGLEISWLRRQEKIEPASLDNMSASLAALSEDLQRIYQGLRPTTLDNLGLQSALIALIDEYGRSCSFVIERRLNPEACREWESCGIFAYRIVQEALTNIARHSGATAAEVALYFEGAGSTLFIRDNGAGFDLNDGLSAGRHGLIGIRERATACGAYFDIQSVPGSGTTLKIIKKSQ